MKNKFKPFSLIWKVILVLLIAYLPFACKQKNPFVDTPVSGETVIDIQEQEIVFDKPFKPKKMVNKVCFAYSDKLNAEPISESPKFPDGVSLQLSASVVDQNGRKYELNDIENSVENYLCIRPKDKNWLNISKTDAVFVKLILHSNRKINISKIEWVSYDIWDI